MLHEPAPQESGPDRASEYKARLGVYMFIIYALVYAGFVAIPLIDPALMDKKILLGMNLAPVYGFGLIIFALVLALIYNQFCSRKESAAEPDGDTTASAVDASSEDASSEEPSSKDASSEDATSDSSSSETASDKEETD